MSAKKTAARRKLPAGPTDNLEPVPNDRIVVRDFQLHDEMMTRLSFIRAASYGIFAMNGAGSEAQEEASVLGDKIFQEAIELKRIFEAWEAGRAK